MKLLTRNERQYRRAKLEQILIEESEEYVYDENGDVKVDEFGEPETKKEKRKTKIYTTFRYNMVDQASIDKNQYISNIWNQDATFTIKTYDPIDPVITDRVIVKDKVYTITNIYKDFDDSTASMFNDGGYYVTYLGLKGAISL